MAGATSPGLPAAPGGGPGADLAGLAHLGLQAGEAVRWQAGSNGRWRSGTATHRERDGSIGVTDSRGAARSLPVERIHVHCVGPRGGVAWENLTVRAGRNEQLCLLDDAPVAGGRSDTGSQQNRAGGRRRAISGGGPAPSLG